MPYYAGKYRSDLCRLLQLYAHGGVYVDNDMQLLRSLDRYRGYALTTVLESPRPVAGETGILQALVAAPPRSPIIKRSIAAWSGWAAGERNATGLLGPAYMMAAIREETGLDPLTARGRAALLSIGINVLTETEPSPEDFSQTQADCLSPFGLHRLRHDYKTNLCGYLVYDGSEPVAYSRMIRSGGSGGSAGLLTDSKDGACAVQTAADNAITSCRCDHPSSSGHRQAGFTCHTTKGDIAWTHRANCSSGAHCASATPWDASFRPPPCVDSSLGRGGRRLAGANNQTVLVTVVTHTATIAGTVDSFDAAAYKHNLAAALEGVSPADISLDLAPASVLVVATIVPPTAEVAQAAFTTLAAATPAQLTSILGVVVEQTTTPTLNTAPAPAPPPALPPSAPPALPTAGLTVGAQAGAVIGSGVGFALVLTAVYVKLGRARASPSTGRQGKIWRTTRTTGAAIVSPVAVEMDSRVQKTPHMIADGV